MLEGQIVSIWMDFVLKPFFKLEKNGLGVKYWFRKWSLRLGKLILRCSFSILETWRNYHHIHNWDLSLKSFPCVVMFEFHLTQTPIPPLNTPRQLGEIETHILQNIGTNEKIQRLQHMPWWAYYKHMCIMYCTYASVTTWWRTPSCM